MGVHKEILNAGNGVDYPNKGDDVTIEYTGNLYDETQASNNYRGNQFDSSVGRGDFQTRIGVGQVIRGWDEGVVSMSLGEKSVLTISPDYAYGDRGFPGLIPAGSTLVFVVELKAINDKQA